MLSTSPANLPQLSFFNVIQQIDVNDPLILLANAINWSQLEQVFSIFYRDKGRPSKPIRLMCGLLILKQLHNLSDDKIVEQWKYNPYYQVFCGETELQIAL